MTDAGTMTVVQDLLEKWDYQYEVGKFFSTSVMDKGGDLADMLFLKETVSVQYLIPKFTFLTFDNRSALPGNTDNVCIMYNQNSLTSKRLLIFGDSFIKSSLPFFYQFSEILFMFVVRCFRLISLH